MSGVPAEIADVGATTQKLAQNPAFDPLRAQLTTEDYFVWSRFDGVTTLKDLLLMTGFPVEQSVTIVRRLRALGAILRPGENPATMAARAAAPTPTTPAPAAAPAVALSDAPTVPRVAARPSGPIPTGPSLATAPTAVPDAPRAPRAPTIPPAAATTAPPAAAAPPATLDDPTPAERAALAEDVELGAAEKTLVLVMHRRLRSGDPWALLGVAHGTDKKALKRSYFKLSKDFHPDRYYRKRLGSFAQRLSEIFEALSHAYAELTEDRTEETPRGGAADAEAQTPAEYAAELYDRACAQEVAGDPAGAMKIFDAAIRVDAQARYFRRAATCAIAAHEVRVAEEYAKKAAALEPQDPSTQRILARAFKAAGKLALAEEVLLMAMQLKNENDTLGKELRSDLAEVRRLIARSSGA